MTSIPIPVNCLSDLELYELLVAAYPEKFGDLNPGRSEDDLWQQVEDFFYEEVVNDSGKVLELLSRMVYLTMPQISPFGKLQHVLGQVERRNDAFGQIAAVKRGVKIA